MPEQQRFSILAAGTSESLAGAQLVCAHVMDRPEEPRALRLLLLPTARSARLCVYICVCRARMPPQLVTTCALFKGLWRFFGAHQVYSRVWTRARAARATGAAE